MKRIPLSRSHALCLAAALAAAGLTGAPVAAQQAPAAAVATGSDAGKAAAVGVVEVRARVVAIDKDTRTVTLRSGGAGGVGTRQETVDVIAGDDVKNFDRIAVGDDVVVRYIRAVSLDLRKAGGAAGAPVVTEGARQAAPGDRPAAAKGREIRAVAEVTAVDPKAGTITLKGPRGNSVPLAVKNPEHFKVVKKGDKVDVTYVEAVAVAVEPAAKK
jgi:Cu/Ag efflux protein CusF